MAVPPELARHLDDPDVKDTLGSERKLFELRRQGRLGQKKQLQERTAPARPIQFPGPWRSAGPRVRVICSCNWVIVEPQQNVASLHDRHREQTAHRQRRRSDAVLFSRSNRRRSIPARSPEICAVAAHPPDQSAIQPGHQQSNLGTIIAGSILGARALAPVDLAIANWHAHHC